MVAAEKALDAAVADSQEVVAAAAVSEAPSLIYPHFYLLTKNRKITQQRVKEMLKPTTTTTSQVNVFG